MFRTLALRRSESNFNSEVNQISNQIHSDEGLTLEMSVFESFTVANLPYRPCG